MATDPRHLLDELSALRRRARRDRHGYWFPFLLFGVIVAAAIPWYLPARCELGCSWSANELPALWHWLHPTGQASKAFPSGDHPSLWKDFYWMAALTVGFLATVWWYRWRAAKVGVETSTRLYVQVTVFVLAFPLLGVPLATRLVFSTLGWPVALSVLVVGVLVATLLAKRKLRTAVVILSLILVAHLVMIFPFGPLLVVAVGVLGLAWVERSALCTSFAVLFAAWALFVNGWSTWVYGSVLWPWALIDFADLLSSSLILVLGGIGGLIARRVRGAVPA
ncbi:hypothetical protein ADK67_47675 [Saccharothrix sp. NRRL B-16348]|uniref:hypothetical protein n=1 Tax=Saccharothrix sp. NRRL B-16348 TaxID=1415542 RepID=UPI0006B05B95|nr:hypothetical protein [Saccharothrix sp. NRRL B-16348]KOX12077.1 hypothetical protein ADK67_47675 [Saccharothrix sp. NRRL B-16348]